MKEKQPWMVLTFPTTTAAMAMETLCAKAGLPGRLIPVPREITAGCGMSWRAPLESREVLTAAARQAGLPLDGIYEILL